MLGNGPQRVNPAQLMLAKCRNCASVWRRAVSLNQCLCDRLDQKQSVQAGVTFFFCANCGRQLHFNGDLVDPYGQEAAPPEAYIMDWHPVKGDLS